MLTFPRDLVAELYLGAALGWVDVTTSVRQEPPVVFTRGVKGEQGRVAPSSCTFHLHNPDGRYTPDNPVSPYYQQLGRNTPVRLALRAARDQFGRSVSNGWGTSDTGDVWSQVGTAADFSVNGTNGLHSISTTSSFRFSYLAGLQLVDARAQVTFTLPFTDVTGGAVEPANILLRGQGADECYMIRCTVTTAEAVTLAIHYIAPGGAETVLAGPITVAGLTHSSAQAITVAGEAEGQTIRCKAWAGVEPHDWHLQVVDTLDRIPDAGWCGVRSGVGSGNTNTKPIVFSYDDVQVRIGRFAGETVELDPRWNPSHTVKWVEVTCSSVLRRLEQSRDPGKSVIERAVTRFLAGGITPIPIKAYWPLDDEKMSVEGRETIKGEGSQTAFLNSPAPLFTRTPFGTGDLAPWLRPSVVVNQGRALICATTLAYVGSFNTHLMVKFKGVYSSASRVDRIRIAGIGAGNEWILTVESFTGKISLSHPTTQAALVDMFPPVFDDQAHHVGFYATQNGANVDWSVFFDGTLYGTGTVTGYTAQVDEVGAMQADTSLSSDSNRDRIPGHVLIIPYPGEPFAVDVYEAYFGFVGEAAGRRLERLCSEEGIALDHFGGLDDTAPMGPQYAEPLIKVLTECAVTSQGLLYETRGTVGLGYRQLQALENRPVLVTLDYSAGHIAPPFFPKDDDRHTRNIITAKRRLAGEVTLTADTGPLNAQLPEDDPDGVGPYPGTATVNVADDDQLADIATWLLHVGTTPDARFPAGTVDLRAPDVAGNAALVHGLLALDIGDRLQVTDMQAADHYQVVDLQVLGYTETLDTAFLHTIKFNGVPAAPYTVFVLDTDRLDSDGTTLGEDLTTAETLWDIAISDGTLWTTDAGDFPFDVVVGGEQCTCTAITTLTSTTQRMTCQRSVNGVVKTHTIGAQVSLAADAVLAL